MRSPCGSLRPVFYASAVGRGVLALACGLAVISCKTGGDSTLKEADTAATPVNDTGSGDQSAAPTASDAWNLELGEKAYVDAEGRDEDYWVSQLVAQSDKTVAHLQDKTGSARRSAHSKAHGCVTGTFAIEANRPAESKFGIFANDGTYPVWIRFSNSQPAVQADTVPDARGMAVKVVGIDGQKLLPGHENSNAVDFPFVSGPIFPVANVKDYLALQQNLPAFLATHPRSALLTAEVASHIMKNPLLGSFWSMGAFKLGPRAVKFSTRPCKGPLFNIPLTLSPSYLRDAMVKQLSTLKKDACFEFGVQFQKDPASMPVEDPSVEWRESQTLFSKVERFITGNDPVSPFVKIATITIPAQEFATPAQDDFCERLSFNPWRTVAEQRPLGNLMRARLKVYTASLAKRMELNQTSMIEDHLTGTAADVTVAK